MEWVPAHVAIATKVGTARRHGWVAVFHKRHLCPFTIDRTRARAHTHTHARTHTHTQHVRTQKHGTDNARWV